MQSDADPLSWNKTRMASQLKQNNHAFSVRYSFTYIKPTCLWSFNLAFLKKLKTHESLSLFLSSLVCIHLAHLRTDIYGIHHASLFHLAHISLSFIVISFMPIFYFIWLVWGGDQLVVFVRDRVQLRLHRCRCVSCSVGPRRQFNGFARKIARNGDADNVEQLILFRRKVWPGWLAIGRPSDSRYKQCVPTRVSWSTGTESRFSL